MLLLTVATMAKIMRPMIARTIRKDRATDAGLTHPAAFPLKSLFWMRFTRGVIRYDMIPPITIGLSTALNMLQSFSQKPPEKYRRPRIIAVTITETPA